MPSTDQTEAPEITRAAQRYVEQYGDPLVMNTYLKVTILVLALVCVMLGLLTFKSIRALAAAKPFIVRINDVGRAEAIDYRAYEYKPQEAENKYYLSRWASLYFSRNRYTIERDQTQSLYFLNSDVQQAVIREEQKSKTIATFQGDVTQPYVDIEIKSVILDDLRQSPYSARIEFDKVFTTSADHAFIKRESWTASVTYVFADNVANDALQYNPLGLTILRYRADQAFTAQPAQAPAGAAPHSMNNDLELLISFLQPIKDLLLDETVTEIMGNPDGKWWFERRGRLQSCDIEFDAKRLITGLEVIANKLNRKLDAKNPLLNAQLPDGSRLAAVLPPVVRPYPAVTIRKFSTIRFTMPGLIATGAFGEATATRLRSYIEEGKTMLISGGTGSGKTTLLNALADYIPEHERIVVIEDTKELRIGKPNLLGSECQTESHAATVTFNDLLKASLRWRPDRIILGEVRGDEARTLLDSFNTGHAGSMATIHASTAVKALRRFGELAMRSHQQSNRDDIAAEIAESVHVVIQVSRFAEGRRISEIIAVRGYDRDRKVFLYDTIFNLNQTPQENLNAATA